MKVLWNLIVMVTVLGAASASTLAEAQSKTEDLKPLIASLSAGDRSVLETALAEADIEMMTTQGSANDALWSAFVGRGWMTMRPAPDGGPAGLKLKLFTITNEGRKNIAPALNADTKP